METPNTALSPLSQYNNTRSFGTVPGREPGQSSSHSPAAAVRLYEYWCMLIAYSFRHRDPAYLIGVMEEKAIGCYERKSNSV